ncbi:MAG: MTH1187 family thiamine-binding protein [Planctomycetes bacterium]|nr:MTH1187 family thiamine-binding protein [Planctomycetota bacterium]
MYLMEFSMSPLSKSESVGRYVARSVEIVERSGLDYRLHAMGTVVEGELEPLLSVLRECFAAMQTDCDRVTCSVKFDYRRGRVGGLESKVASIEQQLGRKLS